MSEEKKREKRKIALVRGVRLRAVQRKGLYRMMRKLGIERA